MVKLSSLVKGNLNSTTLKRRLRKLYSLFLVLFMFVSSSDYSVYQDFFMSAKALDYSNVSITSITLDSEPIVQAGGDIQYTIELSEPIYEYSYGIISFNISNEGLTTGKWLSFNVINNGTTLIMKSKAPIFNFNGDWSISHITMQGVSSRIDFMFTTNPQKPSDFDITTGNFSVTGAIVDTQPPVLISTTMVKNHATLGESIEILAEVSDDVSGVRSPNFVIEYPSGYRTSYGAGVVDSNTVRFNLYVSDFLESGTYKVLAIPLYDNADNFTYNPGLEIEYSDPNVSRHDFSHLTFEITGTRPKPNIPNIINAFVTDAVVNGGSSTNLTVEFEQVDVVYPETMNATYVNAMGIQRNVSLIYAGEGVYNGGIDVGLYDAAVENELRHIYASFDGLSVQYHNQLTYPYGELIADFSGASFIVANSIDDRSPPVLESIASSPKLVRVNDNVLLDMVLSDNLSGIKYVEVVYNTPSGASISLPNLLTNETTVQLVHNVQKYHESGLYTIRYVKVEDQAGNAAFYVSEYLGYSKEIIFDFSEASFTVEGTLPPPEAPNTVSVSLDKSVLVGSDSTVLRITVDKTHQDYSYAQAYYINEFGETRRYHLTYIGNGVFETTLQTSLYEKVANYVLTNIQIRFDGYGGFIFYNEAYDPTQSPSLDLSGGDYSVTETIYDAQPPQLTGVTVSPSVVTIGQKAIFSLDFLDDVSGVSYVELNLINDQGQTRGFGFNPSAGVYSHNFEFNISKYTSSGVYSVNYIQVHDRSGKNAYYVGEPRGIQNEIVYDFSSISVTVEGTLPPPTVPDTVSVSVDKAVLVGADSTILRVTVDKTHQDYSYAYGYYINQYGQSKSHQLNYVGNGVFEGSISSSLYAKEADYHLTHINFNFDGYGGFNFFNEAHDPLSTPSMDLSGGNYSVTGTLNDTQPPQLIGISVSPSVVTIGQKAIFSLDFLDDVSGVSYIGLNLINDQGQTTGFGFNPEAGVTSHDFEYNISKYTPSGVYSVNYVQVQDHSGKYVIYVSEPKGIYNEVVYDFSSVSFTVEGTVIDNEPPQLTGISVSPSLVTIGQKAIIGLNFLDDVSGVSFIEVGLINLEGHSPSFGFHPDNATSHDYEFNVSKYTPSGLYKIRYIRLQDQSGKSSMYVSEPQGYYNEIIYDFSSLSFTVEGTLPPPEAPDSVSISVDKPILVGADSTILRITVDKTHQEYMYASAYYINQFGESVGQHLYYIGNGVFEGTISSSLYEREAIYQLTHLTVAIDEYGSFNFYNEAYDPLPTPSMDLSGGNYSVTETQHGNAPRFDYLYGTFNVDRVTENQQIKYTLYLNEPNHEYGIIYASFYNEHDREIHMPLYPIGEGIYEGATDIGQYTTPGTYQLMYLYSSIGDYEVWSEHQDGGTEYPYFDFSVPTFEVYGTVFDIEPPYIVDSTLNKELVEKGDWVYYDFFLEDDHSYPTWGYITLVNENNIGYENEMQTFQLEQINGNHFRVSLYIHSYVKNGKWSVHRIYLGDAAGNGIEYYNNYDYNFVDLSHLDFVVQNNVEDNTPPSLNSIEVLTPTVKQDGKLKVQLDVSDDYSEIQKVYMHFAGKTSQYGFYFEGEMLSSGLNVINDYVWSNLPIDEYELTSIEMSDWSGNWVRICNTNSRAAAMSCHDNTVNLALGHVKFQLQERVSIENETVIEESTITPTVVEGGQEIVLTLKLAAKYWGAHAVNVSYPDVYSPDTYPYFEMVNMGNGIFQGKILIDSKKKWKSEYQIGTIDLHFNDDFIQVANVSYSEIYPGYSYTHDFSHLTFSVLQTYSDQTSPEVSAVSIGKNNYNQNDILVFNMQVIELESYLETINIRFRVDNELAQYPFDFSFYSPNMSKTGAVTLEQQLTKQFRPGFVEVDQIIVNNSFGHSTVMYNEKFYPNFENAVNLDHLAFTLAGDTFDLVEPKFESISLDKNLLGPNEVINIEVSANDFGGSGVRSAFVSFRNSLSTSMFDRNLYTRLTLNNEGKLTGSITINPYTLPGNYVISYIYLSDFAGNYAYIDPINSSSSDWSRFYYLEKSFNVVGTQLDDILPTFTDFTLSRQEALIGETIEATVDAFDEPSGLQYFSISYRSRQRVDGNYGFYLYGFAPSNPTDPFIVSGTIGNYVQPGVYEVSYVYMQDYSGNVRTIYNSSIDNPELNIKNFSDKTITIYGETEQITIESVSISQQQLLPGSQVDLVMDINDDIIKPDQVTAYYTSDLGQQKEVVMTLSETSDYFGQLLIGEFEPSDTWTMDRIVFIDRFGSEFILYNQAVHLGESSVFDATAANFVVDNPNVGDLDAPQLNGVEVTKGSEEPALISVFAPRMASSYFRNVNTTTETTTAFYPNDIVEFKVDAADDVSGVDRLLITYLVGSSTVEFDVALVAQTDGTYIGRTRIKDYHPSGIWYVTKFVLVDKAGNKYVKQTTDPTSGLTMFDHLRLTVERTTHDQLAPVLSNIVVTDKTLGKGDVLEILADASDDFSGITKFDVVVSARTIGVERKITMNRTDSGQFVGQMSITDNIVADFWIIKSVELVDVAGNIRIIQNEKISNPNKYELRNFDEQNFVVRGLASIQLISAPTRLKYHIGDSFDPSGLRVKAVYTDGSEEEIDFAALVLHGYNNSIVNPKLNILVQYQNRSTSFAINVYQRQPELLVKLTELSKNVYFVDEALDKEGLSFEVVYDDGVTKILTDADWTIANPSVTSEAGQKQIIVQHSNITTTVDITVLKRSSTAPDKPEVISVTDKTISVFEVSGQEYSLNGIEWQSDGLFVGLQPNQAYAIYTRNSESRTHLASQSSAATLIRTDRSPAETPFEPTLLYRTDLVIAVEVIEGQLYSIDGTTWQQGGMFAGLNPNTTYYVITKIAQTDTTYESEVSDALVVTTDLLHPSTPSVPVLKQKTQTCIEVNVVSGQEYSLDGLVWQDGGLFEGLLSYVQYSIYTRVKATENNYVSDSSDPLVVYTLKSMTALEINQEPTKLVYEQGDPIDLQGLIVWGYFNDGSIENVTVSYVNIVNPEVTQSVPGNYTVIMNYDDFTVTFDIEIIAKVEKQTPVQITRTETMMVIVSPKGKVKVIMFDNNGRREIAGE